MTEKSNRVEYEMKYIGWNIGATRVESHDTMGDIEILELKIDGVDVLKQLEKAEKWERLSRHLSHGPGWVIDSITTDGWGEIFGAGKKLEAVKELNREYDAKPSYELDLIQFHNFRAKLWKILKEC